MGSDNGLSPVRRQAIIWTNAGILLIGPLGTNFGEILIVIQTFSFKKLHLKTSSAKWRLFCLGLNWLNLIKRRFTLCFHSIFCAFPNACVHTVFIIETIAPLPARSISVHRRYGPQNTEKWFWALRILPLQFFFDGLREAKFFEHREGEIWKCFVT